MKRKLFALMLALMMMIAAGALADAPVEELTAEETLAAEAVLAAQPGAQVNYLIKERDDGRWEWDVFFQQGTALGEATVNAETYAVLKTKTYDNLPADALTADQAVAKLKELKGALTITELDFDRDDGSYRYEGSAELDGKRYEFEMTVSGKLVEWERD